MEEKKPPPPKKNSGAKILTQIRVSGPPNLPKYHFFIELKIGLPSTKLRKPYFFIVFYQKVLKVVVFSFEPTHHPRDLMFSFFVNALFCLNDITKRASKPSFRHSLYVDHIGFYSAKTQYLHFLFLFCFSNLEAWYFRASKSP